MSEKAAREAAADLGVGRLMVSRPDDLGTSVQVRDLRIYKRYFDLVANGAKTIEVRVAYPSRRSEMVGPGR
jgi:hypothetical protein